MVPKGQAAARSRDWRPRPYLGSWTPDQAEAASLFPKNRRVAISAANGIGKSYLAADLVVSFIQDHQDAQIILVAPTNRQVDLLLWPMVAERLVLAGLKPDDWIIPRKPKAFWPQPDADKLIGFATNTAQRMQGFHAENLFIVLDEASGLAGDLVGALEGIAVAENNFVLAIGNPNDNDGAFWQMFRSPAWTCRSIGALTHPNILARKEIIPGATTWLALTSKLRDWCQLVDNTTVSPDVFQLTLADAEWGHGDATEPVLRTFQPNDEFRTRFLGWFPRASAHGLFSASALLAARNVIRNISGRKLISLDIARFGGDRTVYSRREGNSLEIQETIPPATLPEQAIDVNSRLMRDRPDSITIDAAGLGIGLIDNLAPIAVCPIKQFLGGEAPLTEEQQRRYHNRRTAAAAQFADAIARGLVYLPPDAELDEEFLATQYWYDPAHVMHLEDKHDIHERLGRSPDKADGATMLWEEAEPIELPSMASSRAEEELAAW